MRGLYLSPKENKKVESCRLLGRACEIDVLDVLNHLEKSCPRIKDCGYNIEESVSKQVFTDDMKRDIRTVIKYLMDNEFKQYQESDQQKECIYHSSQRLKVSVNYLLSLHFLSNSGIPEPYLQFQQTMAVALS